MRNGRKSRSVRFSAYERHVLQDVDTGLVRTVGVTLANAPEASVTKGIALDLAPEFSLDCEREPMRCTTVFVPFEVGGVVRSRRRRVRRTPLRERCTKSTSSGRSVNVHPDERLLRELGERQRTPAGRKTLREWEGVEHSMAHIGRWEGDRARYRACARTSWISDARRSCTTCTSWPTRCPMSSGKLPRDYSTGALVRKVLTKTKKRYFSGDVIVVALL